MRRRSLFLSDSEGESEPEQAARTVPSDDVIETTLRRMVFDVWSTGKFEELTVRRIRGKAEKVLGLDEGFFKGDERWKVQSDQIIKDEVAVQEETAHAEADRVQKKPSPVPEKTRPAKRTKAEAPSKPRKRPKTSFPGSEEYETSESPGYKSEGATEKAMRNKPKLAPEKMKKTVSSDSEEVYNVKEEEEEEEEEEDEETKPSVKADASESEMSVVLDEAPNPSRKRQTSTETSRKGRKKNMGKGKDADLDPNQAEIKRLQGWLVKCGIRKMWSRELAPYLTPKEKIRHLKAMLKDAGMEGRPSLEKARQIREERELKEDLEMVQEGAKRWGTGSADEDSDGNRPRRRRVTRARQSLAFLENEGEETE